MPKTLWLRSKAPHPFQLPDGQLLQPGEQFEIPTADAERLTRHPLLEVVSKTNPQTPPPAGDSEKSGDQ